ncbi:hypothetical protein [Candidatus Phytoplasma pruni]|uniref:Uncharacterized protein n=1 Tax=Candidatus Phytoplasma pruni TaxID=479893 RepID=A0A851H9B7_9MOLU|nr:hypothetical protein [Candidatus Phytoplasma pruni]NWN45522.1 hypothetical protein [Candidatus Phytoplasma pruni]
METQQILSLIVFIINTVIITELVIVTQYSMYQIKKLNKKIKELENTNKPTTNE